MSQAFAYPCSHCGFPLMVNQLSCPNCGAIVGGEGSHRAATPGQGQYVPPVRHTPYPSAIRQTPLPYSQPQQAVPPYSQPQQQARPQSAAQKSPLSQPGSYRSPVFVTPTKASASNVDRERQMGCGIGIVALLVIALFATGGYLTLSFINARVSGTSLSVVTTPTQASVTNIPINATLTYAGVTITIVDVQQSASFPEDINLLSAPGEVRLDIEERNTVANVIGGFAYRDVARIILPTSKSVAPVNTENGFAPDVATLRTNWLDFPVPTNINASELLLRLGKVGEAEMNVLLRSNVDVSRYQPKVVKPNAVLHYSGVNWTITAATLSWSLGDQQASMGMRYVTLTLKADNPTSQAFSATPDGYMRLKAASTTSVPIMATFPPTIGAKATGATGTIVFVVPQDVTAYTFVLVAGPAGNEASANFQI